MAISGQETINIGAQNQTQGSDDLYTAFNKVQNNFTQLFSTSSPFNTFNSGNGIFTSANSITGVVTITNTGVLNLIEGTGVALSGSNGNVIISLTGNGNVGVTSVGVESPANTLNVANTPIVSSGNISIDLQPIPITPTFAPGEYIAPTITVDQYGRVNAIANTAGVGTVSNIAITAIGEGLDISGSPITSNGVITIQNTGVTSIRPGTGIQVNSSNGEVTIAALNVSQGTVTRIDFSSNTLVVTGSPVTTSGNITIDLPGNIDLDDILANTIVANVSIDGPNISANLFTGNYFVGEFDGIIGNTTPAEGHFTDLDASGNVVGANVIANADVYGYGLNAKLDDSYLTFTNTAGNQVAFLTPGSISDSYYYVPNSAGYVNSVMGITANGVVQTLGWKTIITQYVSILLRGGGTFSAPPDVQRRTTSILARDGTTYVNVTLS